ncbi:MAG: gliding motility-associated C-terminal domain-containing protein [Chitinophagales bacterium]
MRNFYSFIFLIFFTTFLKAQPANDACPNATLISNVNNFCSANAAGTTVNATDDAATTGGFAAATCWGGTVNDVWYKFVATASDVSITINGNQGSPVGGSLNRPQVALYSGTCTGTINELVCGSAPAGQNIIQVYKGGLTIGETYLIRVDGVNANKGTFQYCINNFNPVPVPSSDCPTAVALCSKDPFTVPSVSGAGTNNTEMNDAACFGGGTIESNSTWYAFTFGTSGTFNFTLVPSNAGDDLDFVVYKLPNGIGNCTGKSVQRCMASAPLCTPGGANANTSSTGLSPSAQYNDEYSGCNADIAYLFCGIGTNRCQSQFAKELTVVAGETYALAINNFTSTGNGFSITFGGTADILGPVAVINDNDADDQICPGEAITFTDGSTPPPLGTLVQWTWNFGVGATPATYVGQNPPTVTYASNGVKTISLTVKSNKGCLETVTKNITVTNVAPTVSIAASSNSICPGTNVTFTATPTNAGSPPTYQWYLNNNPVGTNSNTYSNNTLNNGDQVKVRVTSTSACNSGVQATSNVVTMIISNPLPVDVTISGNSAICPGASLTLTANPTNGGATPAYQWFVNGNPVGTNSNTYTTTTFNNGDIVTVRLTSSLGCVSGNPKTSNPVTVTVKTNPTVTVNSPSICSGSTATLTATGATTYTWTGGLSGNPATSPVLTTNTSYTVTGTANGCTGTAVANVTVKTNPTVTVNSPTICSGQTATLTANGATTYTWSGGLSGNPVTTPALTTNTNYTVTGTTNGCTGTAVATVTVTPKPTVTVNSPSICSGQTATLTANGATSYTWTGGLSGNPATTPALTTNTSYTVTGTANGCTNTAVANVTVKTNPTVTVNSPSICSSSTATLTASGATTYTWTGGLSGNPAITPALTTNTSYTVTGTANGCTGTAVANVTVKTNPTVTVNSPTICSGQTATLTANGATTYTWSGGLSGNPATTPALTTNTNYTVTGTTNGCTGTAVATVTVNANPNVTVNSPSICSGQTATLTANGATSYTWTGGLSGNPATTPALTTNTSYTVTGTTNGCTKTAVATVTVKTNPTLTVNSPSICSGQTATLTASGATTYTWTGGLASSQTVTTPALTTNTSYTVTGTTNGCTGTAVANVTVKTNPTVTVNSPSICNGQTATLTANGAAAYTWTGGLSGNPVTTPALSTNASYTVTGTTNGCTGTAVATVTVKPNPIVTVNSPNICTNQTATLTANGATTYTWTGGLSGNPATTPSLPATTAYTVTGTTNGCTGTAVATVTVKPNLTIDVNSPNICAGQTATLTATGGTTYTWTGGLSGNPATTPALSSSQSYTVTGTTNGCTGTAVAVVTVTQLPTVTVNSPSICAGQTATLTATGATTYTWTGGLSGNPATTPALNANQNYTVTGTTNGCTGSAVATVTVKPNPTVTVNSESICDGQTATLTANGATTYTWTGGLSGNPVTTPALSSNQSYTVTGTTNGCTGTAVATVTVKPNPTVGVNSPSICDGQSATLTATGAAAYTWTGGLSGNPATTPALSSNQSYTVTGTTNGCTGTAVANVTVKPNPVVTVNSPIICSGQTTTLTATGAATYTWSGGLSGNPVTTPVLNSSQTYTVKGTTNGCSSPLMNAVVTVNPTKTTNITQNICSDQSVTVGSQTFNTSGLHTVVLQTSKGCDSTVNLTLNVTTVLTPTVTLTSNKNDICKDDVVVFTANAQNTRVPPTYQWFLNGIQIPNANGSQYTSATLNDNDKIEVKIHTTATCMTTQDVTSNAIVMKVSSINYNVVAPPYCIGKASFIDLNIPQTAYTVSWRNGTDTFTTVNSDSIPVSNKATTTVQAIIRYGNGCSKTLNIIDTVYQLPAIDAVVDKPNAKYEEEVQLNVNGGGSLQYNWMPANAVNNDSIKNPTSVITATTLFSVEVKDKNGCVNADSVKVFLINECTEDFIFVPSAFSPNNDGVNDCFKIISPPKLTNYHMVIFDRWGEKVFESNSTTDCWNGRYKGAESESDSYIYVISFICYNGTPLKKQGTITLLK